MATRGSIARRHTIAESPSTGCGLSRAVVLAGGRGTRLKPFTFAFPKPLVPVGDVPILDIIVGQLRQAGITRVTLAVGHLAELIMAYFSAGSGDGGARHAGLTIEYCREPEPLGTAGPLTLVPDLTERFLVMNGDVLCSIDFTDLVRRHCESGAIATIASYEKTVQSDLGILEIDAQGRLVRYLEKPVHTHRVSMGIYVFEPEVLRWLEPGVRCDLPEVIERLVAAGQRPYVYRFGGYWLDIGRPEDYARAVEEFAALKGQLLG